MLEPDQVLTVLFECGNSLLGDVFDRYTPAPHFDIETSKVQDQLDYVGRDGQVDFGKGKHDRLH